MSSYSVITVLTLVFVTLLHVGNSARILAICPMPSISHQVVLRGLALALNKRGHELVVITTDPVNDPNLKNYTEIDMSYTYNNFPIFTTEFVNKRKELKWFETFLKVESFFHSTVENILDNDEFKKLYKPDSGKKFDVIFLEMLFWNSLYPLANRFDAPIIGIASFGIPLNVHYAIGNPIQPSHPSLWQYNDGFSGNLPFFKRLNLFIEGWRYLYYYYNAYRIEQEAIAKKYFGNDIPSLNELEKNISLIFVNQQGPLSFTGPSVPGIIEIGNFHVAKKTPQLPKDLQKIFDEATDGFIYMSLGSNVKSYLLPERIISEINIAFSKLPYKILWKYENETLPGKPDNVISMKWTPQQAILAHPNLKVFIYQGGLQSTEEATSHAVPLIGLPVFGDQDMQVTKLETLGVAKKLEISTLKSEELIDAIRTVVLDKSYKQRMLNLRSLLQDKSQDPLENAIWWTEHVIRHRGAPYLRSTTADDPWYQRQDMDIIAFLTAVSVTVFSLILIVSYKVLGKFFHGQTVRSSNKKTKLS